MEFFLQVRHGHARNLVAKKEADVVTEELSEEDQKLKDELDMLVERLGVCAEPWYGRSAINSRTGIRHFSLQTGFRRHKRLYKDLDIIYDSSAKALEVPQTTLREARADIRVMAGGRG